MSVQVVVGRAGTGKTALCLEAIRDALRASPVEGPHLIFLVPEQAAFQMERALIETPDVPGYVRCDVLSFRRLAHRILNEAGGALAARPLGPLGRLMAVRLVLRRLEPELRVLRLSRGGGAGLLRAIATSLNEWIQEELEPDRLRELADSARADDPHSAQRLADLCRIYEGYREFLAAGRLDPAQELSVAEPLAGRIAWLRGAHVWVDGFAGFTASERRMLVRLAGLAGSMTISLLIDPASRVLEGDEPGRFSLFSRTERTYAALRKDMQAAGIEWRPVRRLTPARPPRFASEDLVRLEARVFRAPPEAKAGPPVPRDVQLIAAANRRVEVQAAVAEIQRLVRTQGLRYRDIAVVVRHLDPYHDLLSAAMSAYGVPFFIDRRRGTAHHPLVELLRLLPALAARRFLLDDVRLLLKTGLVPLKDHEADALENYAVAHGLSGTETWLGKDAWRYARLFTRGDNEEPFTTREEAVLDRVNEYRRRLTEPLREWMAFAAGRSATGRQWADRLRQTLVALDVQRRMETWAREAAEDGRTEEADVHRQVWRDATELLEDFAQALETEELACEEVPAILEAGLAEFTLGLAPPTLDQVLVGSIERSRHPELAAVLLLGFNDGLFPATPPEDVLLSDTERDRLSEKRPPVGTTRRQRILDEKMLAYIAFTRPSRYLWVSYPRADEAGRPLRPSMFIEDLMAALPGLALRHIEDPVSRRDVWPIGRVADLAAGLALEFRSRTDAPQEDGEPEVRGRWNALYGHVCGIESLDTVLRPVLASLAYRNEARLEASVMPLLHAEPVSLSASRIETFAACPFRYFAEYVLGLTERVEFAVEAVDLGLLHHKILEELFAELIREGRSLGDLDPEQIRERLEQLSRRWAARLADEALLNSARNTFLLNRSSRHLRGVAQRLRLMAQRSRARPAAVEWTFGLRNRDRASDAEPVEIRTPKGRRVFLRGKIDRVDLVDLEGEMLGVVFDYKQQGRSLPLYRVYHGIEVQLLTYVLALVQRGETLAGRPVRPIGAFYVPLRSPPQSVAHPDKAEDPAAAIPGNLRPKGLLEADSAVVMDPDLRPGAKSAVYSASINRDGRPNAKSDAYAREDLGTVRQFVVRKIGELADRMLDGDISIAPFRIRKFTACTYCHHRAVCRFDYDVNDFRELQDLRRDDALRLMAEQAGEAAS